MAWGSKSRNNKNVKRLLKQIEISKSDWKEYRIRPLRLRSYYDVTYSIGWYDLPERSYYNRRNWKSYRKSQYK